MVTTLLQEWKAWAPAPRFSKNSLERDSAREFESLVRKGILVYDLPSGQELIYDSPSCRHGCSLFVEDVGGKWEGVCREHPEEGKISVDEDQLNRYKFSVENLIKGIRAANELEGEIVQCGRGYYFGYKIYSGKKIGLAIFSSVTKYNLSSLAETVAGVKEYDCIFVIAPFLLRLASGAVTKEDRWVSVDELIADGVATEENWRRRRVEAHCNLPVL